MNNMGMESRYITPAVTIFDDKGRIDTEQNQRVYDSLKGHVSGFVVMGSTGEFFTGYGKLKNTDQVMRQL